jgi:uncharacterized protein
MKLHLAQASGTNLFTGYGPGYVSVNNARHERHLLVMSDQLLEWDVAGFESLAPPVFEHLLVFGPELIIVGTGSTLRFPPPAMLQPLTIARVGAEIMDSRAACRTYNILSTEGRRVLAAILVE